MSENYVVGNVISIEGLKIRVLMNEQSNLESFYYDGKVYDGISIGSYIGIIRGSSKIVCRVDKEFLNDKLKEPTKQDFSRDRYERVLEVSLVGNISSGKFEFGIKRFPMIYNEAVLLTEEEVKDILQKDISKAQYRIPIGRSVNHNLSVEIAWDRLFNTHIGIFGNTGSGKSNTLAKLYSELFNKQGVEIQKHFANKSKFVILDFNGEYVKEDVLCSDKEVINLSTRDGSGDKIKLRPKSFWDIETLSIIYSATEKTQQPFLKNAVNYYLDEKEFNMTTSKIIDGLGSAFYNIFSQNNNKEMLNLMNKSLEIIGFDTNVDYCIEDKKVDISWLNSSWHSSGNTYYFENMYFDNPKHVTKKDILEKRDELQQLLTKNFSHVIDSLPATDKLKIACNTYLIYSLAYGKVSFDFINPLISRIESRSNFIENTIEIKEDKFIDNYLTVINLRRCNAEAKKMIPLLIAKELYENHKSEEDNNFEIKSTVHLIIDEAHNILSSQSTREAEIWKDYRLEVFEEIIKEGRKFGFYLTLASQRPSDISPTIMSQLHNYFIHRLVNEQDLRMLENTVNSLDEASRHQIPFLAPGQCIITGTSFEMSLLIQIDKLSNGTSPTSESANLVNLWKNEYNNFIQ